MPETWRLTTGESKIEMATFDLRLSIEQARLLDRALITAQNGADAALYDACETGESLMAYWVKTEFSGIVDLEKAYLVQLRSPAEVDEIAAWFEGVNSPLIVTGKNTRKIFEGFCRSHAIDSTEGDERY